MTDSMSATEQLAAEPLFAGIAQVAFRGFPKRARFG